MIKGQEAVHSRAMRDCLFQGCEGLSTPSQASNHELSLYQYIWFLLQSQFCLFCYFNFLEKEMQTQRD